MDSRAETLYGTQYFDPLGGFSRELPKDGDFKKARGKWNSPKYQALSKLTNVQDLSTYDEPYQYDS